MSDSICTVCFGSKVVVEYVDVGDFVERKIIPGITTECWNCGGAGIEPDDRPKFVLHHGRHTVQAWHDGRLLGEIDQRCPEDEKDLWMDRIVAGWASGVSGEAE